jgi:MerR family transcriptional regulator, heat shock protein HspR
MLASTLIYSADYRSDIASSLIRVKLDQEARKKLHENKMMMRDRNDGPGRPPDWQGVYGIAVTSDLVGTGVQNLRAYEKAGLLDPARTAGGTRLYSSDDVARLRRIQVLLADGLNLAGIAMVLELEEENQRLRDELARKRKRPTR